MPRITKLMPVGDRLGVILDIPLSSGDSGSVTVLTYDEMRDVIDKAIADERERCCKIVWEHVTYGTVAQRTVDAIRDESR